ncbi:zeta toxin family protein [Gilvimarinus japonicus]|mgnify:FL=1|uniref:Zeta toxin family protein n=1 Tax=Gilvimarinus japonicus TaxID=1796469 RepID=A0ABV7I019_9GAMM
MELSATEQKIKEEAEEFARCNKGQIAKELTCKKAFPSEISPVSVFMAGSPGAGKTEASIELIEKFTSPETGVLRIDPDELRERFPHYSGDNSYLFQGAVSIIVNKIHDLAIKSGQSFVLDGTLSNYDQAHKNIARSLNRHRFVLIQYVYQKPLLAWEFVEAREVDEGRRIPLERFVDQYFAAREVVNQLKVDFGRRIQIDLLLKNSDNTTRSYKANIDRIDHYLDEKYTPASLLDTLKVQFSAKLEI